MIIRCPYCKSSNTGKYYGKEIAGNALDLGVALLRSFVTGAPYHTPTTHFGDAASMQNQYKCKNCGRIFEGRAAVSTIKMNEKQTFIFEKIRIVVANVLSVSPNEVTMNAEFYEDLGADSLDMVEISIELEKEFHISADDEAESIKTVEDAVLYVYSKL